MLNVTIYPKSFCIDHTLISASFDRVLGSGLVTRGCCKPLLRGHWPFSFNVHEVSEIRNSIHYCATSKETVILFVHLR